MIGTTLGHDHLRFQALLEEYEVEELVGHWWDTQAQLTSTRANCPQ